VNENRNEEPLSSWKEIGAYLQRNEATARRWEREEGLPIHRHSHKSRSSVYAYPSEIDVWRAGRKVVPEPLPLWKTLLAPPRSLAFGVTMALCLVMVGNGLRPQRAEAQAGGMSTHKVWDTGTSGSVSPDGRYLSFIAWDKGDLAIHDLVTGQDRRLTHNEQPLSPTSSFAWWSVISPDGTKVAYAWFNKETDINELRVVRFDGSEAPRVLHNRIEVEVTPYSWSPDGKWIGVIGSKKDGTKQIGLVDSASGLLRVLKTVGWDDKLDRLYFSPDGKFAAYDLPGGENALQRDVFVMATDGSRETPAVVHPARESVVGWTREGLVFISDRSGSSSIWLQPMKDGRPSGDPKKIRSDSGWLAPLGIANGGTLFYETAIGGTEFTMASFDFAAGKLLTQREEVSVRNVGLNSQPDWSWDGKYLVYVTPREHPRSLYLNIQEVATGNVREVQPALSYFQMPRWAPDGRSFLVRGSDLKGRAGTFRVDAQTGAAEMVIAGGEPRFPVWAGDGRRIYYLQKGSSGPLVERDLASGLEREIASGLNAVNLSLSVSPDGKSIAFLTRKGTNQFGVVVLSLAGGAARELATVEQPYGRFLAWAPDGQSLFTGPHRITLTGQVTKPDFGSRPSGGVRIQPGGNKMVFLDNNGPKFEVWALENFLPKATAAR
jgi:Tol biopolymer transport system component